MPGFKPIEALFKGRHFDQEIVVLGVRWYLSFQLSFRDLVAMMGERGIELAHTTNTGACVSEARGITVAYVTLEGSPGVRLQRPQLDRLY